MSSLEELQGRILTAMDRITAGLDELEKPRPEAATAEASEDAQAFKQALDEEKVLTAQLEERIRVLHERQVELEADLAAAPAEAPLQEVADSSAAKDAELVGALRAMAEMEKEINRLRSSNEALRENNQALRTAHEASGALVDAGLAAELEALRAEQSGAKAQADAILSALMPLVIEEPASDAAAPGANSEKTEDS